MKERAECQKEDSKHETNTPPKEIFTPKRGGRLQKIDKTLPAQNKPCIICNNLKRKGDNKSTNMWK